MKWLNSCFALILYVFLAYDFDYANIGKWSAIDIGLAKVESPYRTDRRYEEICSYIPTQIPISYDPRHQVPGIDAIVMGWGHLEKWREPGDSKIYLQEEPRYAAIRIMNKNKCKEYYADFPELQTIIHKYMICTMEAGDLNAAGFITATMKPHAIECSELKDCRRNVVDTTNTKSSGLNTTSINNARRQGICQNDHGGPLVTWIGGLEYVIGVASVFRVNADSQCEGPYLFASTQCNGAFLDCILKTEDRRMNSICNKSLKERGFDLIHKDISWANHMDGMNGPARPGHRLVCVEFRDIYDEVTRYSISDLKSDNWSALGLLVKNECRYNGPQESLNNRPAANEKENVQIRPQIPISKFG